MEVNFLTVRKWKKKKKPMKFSPVSTHSTNNRLSGAVCKKLLHGYIYFRQNIRSLYHVLGYNLHCDFVFFLMGTKIIRFF